MSLPIAILVLAACHGDAIEGDDLRLSLRFEAGEYENSSFEGDFEGVRLGAQKGFGPVRVSFSLPAYRLARNGPATIGLGDLSLNGSVVVVEGEGARPELAIGLAAAAPTGGLERGMGHFMLSPALRATWRGERLSIGATAGTGHAIGGGAHVHAASFDPMSRQAVDLGLEVAVSFERVRVRTAVGGALSLVDLEAESQLRTGLGLEVGLTEELWLEGGFDLALGPLASFAGTHLGTTFRF